MNKQIAEIIVKQLGGTSRLSAMIGAKFSFDDKELHIRFKGSRKMNLMSIKLNSLDLYDIKFLKFSPSKFTSKEVKQSSNVYAEDMKHLIEQTTGLYLSF